MCRRWDSNPHEVALTGFLSPKRLRDGARYCVQRRVYGPPFRFFAGWCVFVCVLIVTRTVTTSLRSKFETTALRLATALPSSSALGRTDSNLRSSDS